MFYKMMVDYYEGLAKIEHEHNEKGMVNMTPNTLTTELTKGVSDKLGRDMTDREQHDAKEVARKFLMEKDDSSKPA